MDTDCNPNIILDDTQDSVTLFIDLNKSEVKLGKQKKEDNENLQPSKTFSIVHSYYLVMEEAAAELDTKVQETEKLDNVSFREEQLVKVDTSGQGSEEPFAALLMKNV